MEMSIGPPRQGIPIPHHGIQGEPEVDQPVDISVWVSGVERCAIQVKRGVYLA